MLHESWIPAYAGMTTFYEAVTVESLKVFSPDKFQGRDEGNDV